MKKWMTAYAVFFFLICLIPSLGMAVTKTEESGENRTLASMPSLRTEEGVNINYLPQLGDYFQDHFGFRNELVTANALIQGKVFGVSTADGVIQGTDGWLYYKDSLDDYLGRNLMSERGLFNVAHSLSMMQDYTEALGVSFAFTVAPNKNSLYGEQMPYYDSLVITEDNNLARLTGYLESEGVRYVDLYDTLKSQDEILYHERDSHWNNKGAALAAETLMDALNKEHTDYSEVPVEERVDYYGDLDEMLYPKAMTPETEYYYDKADIFAYVGEVESNFDPQITTVNPSMENNLIMYRDSFGNALVPFFANEYGNAYFSRGVPYQMTDILNMGADTLIVERAERFIPDMALNPPVMEGPVTAAAGEEKEAKEGLEEISIEESGIYYKITGSISEEYLDTASEIYIKVNNDTVYEAFPVNYEKDGKTEDNGFCLYLLNTRIAEGAFEAQVIVQDGDGYRIVAEQTVQ